MVGPHPLCGGNVFYQQGEMSAEALEVYRICSRLDSQDSLSILRERGVGKDWLARFEVD